MMADEFNFVWSEIQSQDFHFLLQGPRTLELILSLEKPNASSISTTSWKVFEGFLKAFWRVLRLTGTRTLQKPFRDPFRDPFTDPSETLLGSMGFCSRKWTSWIQSYIAEADADLILVPGQLELHGRCRYGVLVSPCFGALYLLQI